MQMLLYLLVFLMNIYQSMGQVSVPPIMTPHPQIWTTSTKLINNVLTGQLSPTPTVTLLFPTPFASIPNVAYGIQSYCLANDRMYNENFQMVRENLTTSSVGLKLIMSGVTNLFYYELRFMAVDGAFTGPIGLYDNLPINYTYGPLINITDNTTLTQCFSNTINFTSQANSFGQSYKSFINAGIALFINSFYERASGQTAPNYTPIQLRITGTILTNQTYMLRACYGTKAYIMKMFLSVILFEYIDRPNKFIVTYHRFQYPYTGGQQIMPSAFAPNLMYGLIQITSTMSGYSLYIIIDTQTNLAGDFVLKMQPSVTRLVPASPALSYIFDVLYTKTWICPNDTFYDTVTQMCISCPIVGCLVCAEIDQCSICDQNLSYYLENVAYQCVNGSLILQVLHIQKINVTNQIQILVLYGPDFLTFWDTLDFTMMVMLDNYIDFIGYYVVRNNDSTVSIFIQYNTSNIQDISVIVTFDPTLSNQPGLSHLNQTVRNFQILHPDPDSDPGSSTVSHWLVRLTQILAYIVAGLSLLIFLLGVYFGKLVAVEMMAVIQICYLSIATIGGGGVGIWNNLCFRVFGKVWYVNGINYMILKNQHIQNAIIGSRYQIVYLNQRYLDNYNLTFCLIILCYVLAAILWLIQGKPQKNPKKKLKKYGQKEQEQIQEDKPIQKYLCCEYVINFLMFSGYIVMVAFALQTLYGVRNTSDLIGKVSILEIVVIWGIMIIYFGLIWTKMRWFGEYVDFFKEETSVQGRGIVGWARGVCNKIPKKWYNMLIIQRILNGTLLIYTNSPIPALTIFTCILLLTLVVKPYKKTYHNIRYICNTIICIVVHLMYLLYRVLITDRGINIEQRDLYGTQYIGWLVMPLLVCVLLLICIGYSVAIIIYQFLQKCRGQASQQQEAEKVWIKTIQREFINASPNTVTEVLEHNNKQQKPKRRRGWLDDEDSNGNIIEGFYQRQQIIDLSAMDASQRNKIFTNQVKVVNRGKIVDDLNESKGSQISYYVFDEGEVDLSRVQQEIKNKKNRMIDNKQKNNGNNQKQNKQAPQQDKLQKNKKDNQPDDSNYSEYNKIDALFNINNDINLSIINGSKFNKNNKDSNAKDGGPITKGKGGKDQGISGNKFGNMGISGGNVNSQYNDGDINKYNGRMNGNINNATSLQKDNNTNMGKTSNKNKMNTTNTNNNTTSNSNNNARPNNPNLNPNNNSSYPSSPKASSNRAANKSPTTKSPMLNSSKVLSPKNHTAASNFSQKAKKSCKKSGLKIQDAEIVAGQAVKAGRAGNDNLEQLNDFKKMIRDDFKEYGKQWSQINFK